MTAKKLILVLVCLSFVALLSEIVNFFSNSTSESSQMIISDLINISARKAQNGDLGSSLRYLALATKVNMYGNYFTYRYMPLNFSPPVAFSDEQQARTSALKYLSATVPDSRVPEDSGLGKIYYDLGLILVKNNDPSVPKYLQAAMLNNPDFPAFHAEYINYFFALGDTNTVNSSLKTCLSLPLSKILCGQYADDNIFNSRPAPVGYLNNAVVKHYLQ